MTLTSPSPLRVWAAVVIVVFLSRAGAVPANVPGNTRLGALHSTPDLMRDVDIDLRDVTPSPPWQPGDPIAEVPRRHRASGKQPRQTGPRGSLPGSRQTLSVAPAIIPATVTGGVNVEGQGFSGKLPPDPVGDVGPYFFIQAINNFRGVQYTIYSKTTGTALAGPFVLEDLTGELGGGDPIVLYDGLAGRWLLSEFDSSESKLHVAISRSADPISGGWYVYAFATTYFPDYPKYGVWPDGYYVTANEERAPVHKPGYYVMERDRMLAGDPAAGIQRFELPRLSGYGFQTVTPCDLDGVSPPDGMRHVAIRHNDDEAHEGGGSDISQDFLDVFEFHVDWTNPANSAVTGPTRVPIGEYDSHLIGYNTYAVVPQPGTTQKLDPVQQPVMWRLQYRNHGTHESLVGCFTVDLTGSDLASIRWFELRGGAGNWSLYQEGTLTNGLDDGVHRWMGSIAADGEGNIALGYSGSSSSVYPGLRYTGRRAGDPLGVMTLPEQMLVTGGESQTGSYANRFGDYASLNVDPLDRCMFWFTGQYHPAANWSTRIGSFSFDACGCELTAPSILTAAGGGTNRVELAWESVSDVEAYNVYRAVGACGETEFGLIATDVAGTNYADTTASGGVPYAYTVRSANPLRNCESSNSPCVEAATGGVCYEAPFFAGLQLCRPATGDVCSVTLAWDAGMSVCGGGDVVYHVYRSENPAFEPAPENRIAACLTGTNYEDRTVTHNVAYSYIVRAEDTAGLGTGPCVGGSQDQNTVRLTATPRGPRQELFVEDVESGSSGWSRATLAGDVARDRWTIVTAASASPTHAWFCEDEFRLKDRVLAFAAPVQVDATPEASLVFQHAFDTEFSLDGGVLEYSSDGTNWFDVLEGDGVGVLANSNRFVTGAYNSTMDGTWGSPIAGRDAWSGDSSGFIRTDVDIADMSGRNLWWR